MSAEQCRNCRFSKTEGQHLRCRRYPPAVMEARYGQGAYRVLQIVEPEDWCGEWMGAKPGSGLPAEIKPPRAPKLAARAEVGRRGAALSYVEERALLGLPRGGGR